MPVVMTYAAVLRAGVRNPAPTPPFARVIMGVGFGAILPIRRSPAYRPVSADTGGSQSRDEPRGSTQTVIQIEAAICARLGEVEHLVGLRTAERVTIYCLPNGPGITMLLSGRPESVECRRL